MSIALPVAHTFQQLDGRPPYTLIKPPSSNQWGGNPHLIGTKEATNVGPSRKIQLFLCNPWSKKHTHVWNVWVGHSQCVLSQQCTVQCSLVWIIFISLYACFLPILWSAWTSDCAPTPFQLVSAWKKLKVNKISGKERSSLKKGWPVLEFFKTMWLLCLLLPAL